MPDEALGRGRPGFLAIEGRLRRPQRRAKRKFKPDFSSAAPLRTFGLTARAAETLPWLAQGKTNRDIAIILGLTESTDKKHVQVIFAKLGVETRSAATVRALEVLGSPPRRPGKTTPEVNLDIHNPLGELPPV